MKVRFKKLHEMAQTPRRATEGAAGFDLTCVDREYDEVLEIHTYRTGLALEIPPGYVGYLFPRSSVFKTRQIMANCVGVIDSDYRGEVTLKFYDSHTFKVYEPGDRVGQLVIMPVPAVQFEDVGTDELTNTVRGAGGYGSSGR